MLEIYEYDKADRRSSVKIYFHGFRGLGHFPNKIARVYKHEHCLPSAFRSWQVMRSGYRRALLAKSEIAECTYTCCACYSPFPMLASAISLNGNRRQLPPCLPKSETEGRCQWRRSRSS